MSHNFQFIAMPLLLGSLLCGSAQACGFGEAPGGCGGDDLKTEAKYMLNRVVTAINTDQDKALKKFARGEDGFRTMDTYVFCVGPDGIMSAHPSPLLQGHDVRELHDANGVYFMSTMMNTAKAGEVSEIHYLFPRPGSEVATPKTTFYTRAGTQVCGVGVYDGDEPGAAPAVTQASVADLRQRLDAEMPTSIRADWQAFEAALDARDNAEGSALAKLRETLQAASSAFASK